MGTNLNVNYLDFRVNSICKRRFKHHEIEPLFNELCFKYGFSNDVIGKSVQGRSIRSIKFGSGQTKVMLWSQMHGNEPTATAALLDFLNFMGQSDRYNNIRKEILETLSVQIVPMVNPDGAEIFVRPNVWGVDINRDALLQNAPESKVLWTAFNDWKPDFGLNLHDMHSGHYVSTTGKPATVAFLAPPVDEEKSVTSNRLKAMQLIGRLNGCIQEIIPGQVSRYDDTYDERCFGESFQKMGTATVLIESGSYAEDHERQFVRELNFHMIVESLMSVAQGTYEKNSTKQYWEIPDDDDGLYDCIIKNVAWETDGQTLRVDLGIESEEINIINNSDFYFHALVVDIGDLREKASRRILDAEGGKLVLGKTLDKVFESFDEFQGEDYFLWLRQGYSCVRMLNVPEKKVCPSIPFQMIGVDDEVKPEFGLNKIPNFFIEQNGVLKYAIVNGFIYKL